MCYSINAIMDKPFVSVVIPTWRESKILKLCLDSLLKQDYPKNRFEIIFIATKKIDFQDKRAKLIVIEKNKNHAEARNVGVTQAKGEIIAFCDDDCVLPPKWLSTASEYFTKKVYDLVGGPVIPPTKTSFKYRLAGYLAGSRFAVGFAAARHRPILKEQEAREFDLILANTFIRKEAFEKIGGFDKSQVPCEENFLYAKLKQNGYKLLYSPKLASSHPAKPIFMPWAKKIYYYATGRGQMIVRAPETFHLQYFVPSFFFFSLLFLIILSFFSKIIFYSLLTFTFIYFLLNLINTFYIFFKFEKHPGILLAAPVATFMVHLSYGLGFFNGFLRFIIGKREAIRMPNSD